MERRLLAQVLLALVSAVTIGVTMGVAEERSVLPSRCEMPGRLLLAFNDQSNAYQPKADNDRAIREYDLAILLDPQNAPAFYNRGIAYAEKGDLTRAIEDFSRAIQLAS